MRRSTQTGPVVALAASVLCALGCGGCGGGARDPARAAGAGKGDLTAGEVPTAILPGDAVIVAEVDGVPITADCVARQATAHHLDRAAALDECVGFELLARAAAGRGLAGDAEVLRARDTEMVRRFLDDAFVARFPSPEGTDQAALRALYDQVRLQRYYRPVYRRTLYARVEAKNQPEGSAADVAARELAGDIHAALAGRHDISEDEFRRVAGAVAAGRPIEIGKPFAFPRHGDSYNRGAVEPFARATFAITEVGMVAPPVRTQWGWDVILLLAIEPEVDRSFEDARAELYQVVRVREYLSWVTSLVKQHRVEIDSDAWSALAADPSGPEVAP